MRQRQSLQLTRGPGPLGSVLTTPQSDKVSTFRYIEHPRTHALATRELWFSFSFSSNKTKPMALGLENTVAWF